jgi:hypothetical protein
MGEEDNNRYHRRNHGYHANPETADTKGAVFNDHFDLLPLLRRLVCQRKAA